MNKTLIRLGSLTVTLLLMLVSVCAQGLDQSTPAPVRNNTVTGRIAARDLGDARLTDHYYTLIGTPGDLLITVQSQNLNGDVDVFTAGTLRPLLKLTVYAESTAPVTKSIYLRRREDLILRVEARSPNDDDGTYRLFFGGSFEPIAGGPDLAETETATTPKPAERTASGRKTKRVSSVGARVEEPEPSPTEVAAAPTPQPTPEPTPEAKPVESPSPAAEKPAETTTETARPAPARNARTRRPAARRPAPKPQPETEAVPEVGPRLVIETTDGTLINRPMTGIRRVVIENGQVVVVGKDGKIERILLSDIARMSISP